MSLRRDRHLSWVRTSVCAGVLVALAACGGGGGGGSNPGASNPGAPGAASIAGVASKGLLLNARVTAYAVNADGTRGAALASSVTSSVDGSYQLSGLLPGALVLLEVTAQAGTKMVDEFTNTTVDVPASSGFKLRAAATLDSGGATSAQVTPFTDMAVSLAESNNNGKLNADVVAAANGAVSSFIGASILTDQPTFTNDNGNIKATNAAGAKLAAVSQMAASSAVPGCSGDTLDKVKCVVAYLSAQGTTPAAAAKLQTAVTTVLSSDAAISDPLENAKASTNVEAQPTTLVVIPGVQTGVQEAKALIRSVRATAAALSDQNDAASLASRVQAISESTRDVVRPLDDGTMRVLDAVTEALAKRGALDGAAVPGFSLSDSGSAYVYVPYGSSNVTSSCSFFTDDTFTVPAYNGQANPPSLTTTDHMVCRVLQEVTWGTESSGNYGPTRAVFHRVFLSKLPDSRFRVQSELRGVPLKVTPGEPNPNFGPYVNSSYLLLGTRYDYESSDKEVALSAKVSAIVTRTNSTVNVVGELAPGVRVNGYQNANGSYGEAVEVMGTKQVISLDLTDAAINATTTRRAIKGSVAVHKGAAVESLVEIKPDSYVDGVRGDFWAPQTARLVMEGQVRSGFKVAGTLELSNYLQTTERNGFKNVAFKGSVTDVTGVAKLFDGEATLETPADNGLGSSATLNGNLVTTGTNTLTINLSMRRSQTVVGDLTLTGRYVQGSTTFLLAAAKSKANPGSDQLKISTTTGGVGFVAKPTDTLVDIKKGDIVVGTFNVNSGRLVYADGSYEQF